MILSTFKLINYCPKTTQLTSIVMKTASINKCPIKSKKPCLFGLYVESYFDFSQFYASFQQVEQNITVLLVIEYTFLQKSMGSLKMSNISSIPPGLYLKFNFFNTSCELKIILCAVNCTEF